MEFHQPRVRNITITVIVVRGNLTLRKPALSQAAIARGLSARSLDGFHVATATKRRLG
jgi:hypothetical protein